MERIYTIADFTEEDAKYLQSRVEIWADQFNRHAEYIGLKDRAHVGMDIHKMPQVEWDYGYIYTLDPFGEKWEIKFGDNKYKVPKLQVVDKLYSLMDSMVGYKYSSKSKQKTKGESMTHICSMQKKKESLMVCKESSNSDYSFQLWSANHPENEKGPTRFIYVDKPSSSSGWYDVSKEYVDSYEEEMNRRNGNISYPYVAKKVMDMIVSGAIKPCQDPFDTIPNFSRWFKEYPFFISASQQDILDGKYATRSESKKRSCSMSKKKESLGKQSEANFDDLKGMVVSEGTMGVNALIRKYLAVLETYAPDNYKAYIEANPELKDREMWMALDVEDKSYIVDELADELNKIAPEGYYFGASEGDGACYGFWEVNPNEAKKQEANGEEYITEWQADIINGLEKVKDKYGLVIEYNGPFSDEWKEYPTYSVFVRKGGKKEDIGTVGTDYVHAFVDYTSPGMNVSSPHYAKDYSAEEAIQAILNSANMCLGKKGESKKNEGASDTIKVTDENVMLTVNDVYVDNHGGSFSVETPEEGKSYDLLEMQEMIRGMCEDCTGYANYSRDGSELLIEVMAGEMDDNGEWTGDYYTAYSFRCIARIMSYSLEGIIDFLDESN